MSATIQVETVLIPTYGIGKADKNPMFKDLSGILHHSAES